PDHWSTSSVIDWLSILNRVEDIPGRVQQIAQAEDILRARMLNRGTEMVFVRGENDSAWWLMRSTQGDVARLMSIVAGKAEWEDAMPRLAQGLMAAQRNGAWLTTTENLMAGLAIEKFAQTYEAVPVSGRVHVGLDGEASHAFDWDQPQSPEQGAQGAQEGADSTFRPPTDVIVHHALEPW